MAVKSFDDLWAELSAKVATADPESATVRLVESGVHAVGKKLVEEAAEAWMAAEHESPERAAEELSQLLYHVQAMMLAVGVTPAQVGRYL
ncbi:MAG: phosphoribosyl-ATP diphosphatase [Candidatus Nanopelagicales bacterium]